MKSLSKIFLSSFLLVNCLAFALTTTAQKNKEERIQAVKNAVDSQRYTFYAEYVNPLRGTQQYLTPYYTLRITKDTIDCFLPYFGRAYQAPINPADGGIKFMSTNFEYSNSPGKKGSWYIKIRPKDAPEVQQLTLQIFTDGTTTLQVMSTNKDAISFNGYVKATKVVQ
jgi:hypothetical protein